MRPESEISGSDNVIQVDYLTKKFRIPHERKFTIYDRFAGFLKGGYYTYDEFVALNDISFAVRPGETFGIIGPNGSGKSTLLKIIAGIYYPDRGGVVTTGKIVSFVELGVGFQPQLPARDNIFLYGAIMGLKKSEIRDRYEDILAFAELKPFENMKLKNFSSGMVVRLAFSTAIQTDPDILLIDEVLAVGDDYFQQKCIEKIKELQEKKTTILFVSHALEMVGNLCDRCLLLNKGNMVQIGATSEVIDRYHQITREHLEERKDLG